MTPQRPKLPPFQRWLRGIAGVALLLLYPTCNVVRFHWDSEEMWTVVGPFIEALEEKPDEMERAKIHCGQQQSAPTVFVDSEEVGSSASSLYWPLIRHTDDFPGPSIMWDLSLDLVRPIRDLEDTAEDAYDIATRTWEISRSRCTRAAPEDVPEYEAKIAAEARESAAKLR